MVGKGKGGEGRGAGGGGGGREGERERGREGEGERGRREGEREARQPASARPPRSAERCIGPVHSSTKAGLRPARATVPWRDRSMSAAVLASGARGSCRPRA